MYVHSSTTNTHTIAQLSLIHAHCALPEKYNANPWFDRHSVLDMHAHGSHTLSSWVSSVTMLVLIPAVCLAVCVLVLLALRLPGSSLKVGLA